MKEFEPVRVGGFSPKNVLADGSFDYGNGVIGPSSADREFAARQIIDEEVGTASVKTQVPEAIVPFRFIRKLPKPLRKPLLVGGTLAGLASVAVACGGNGEKEEQIDQGEPDESKVERLLDPRHFLELPFRANQSMRIQQGWLYTNGSEHKGIDYIEGELDQSGTWQSFEVLAAADGEACANPASREGKAVFVRHLLADGTILRTYYGHLAEIEPEIPPCTGAEKREVAVKQGEKIGEAGATGAKNLRLVHLHFQVNDQDGKPLDPYDLRAKRDEYPDPNFTNDKICGPDYLWVACPTEKVLSSSGIAWPMYKGNPEHTGQSPYVGPALAEKLWEFEGSPGTLRRVALVGLDGTIFIQTDSKLLAISRDGSLQWEFSFKGAPYPQETTSVPAVGKDGTVYVTADGLHALGPDGSQKWVFGKNELKVPSGPTVGHGGVIYFTADKSLYAVDPDGSLRWVFRKTVLYDIDSMPAVGADGTVYVGAKLISNPVILAFGPDGGLRWVFEGMTGTDFLPPTVGPDGTIYGVSGRYLFAVNNGAKKWEFISPQSFSTASVASDNTVYVASDRLYALGPDGQARWVFHGSREPELCRTEQTTIGCAFVNYSSPLIDARGTVYVNLATGDSKTWLYAVGPDGSQKWEAEVGYLENTGLPDFSELAMGPDGTIYVELDGRILTAIGEAK